MQMLANTAEARISAWRRPGTGYGVSLEPWEFPELELQFERDDSLAESVIIIRFIGKISNSNSYELNRRIHHFGDYGQTLILDLSKLEYINSTGVAILFSIFFRLQKDGYRLIIGGLHPFLRRVFSLMDLPEELLVLDSLDEAKATL
jgi:anti-anti-sigma factor